MPRNLFTFLFGATLCIAIFMTTHAQPGDETLPATTRPPAIRPSKSTIRPSLPTRRTKPTRRPRPPTRRRKPTRTPTILTTRRKKPTRRSTIKLITRRPIPSWWITRIPRAAKTRRPKKCPRKPEKCSSVGPSLCVRSRNGKLCRRVANVCVLRNLNCNPKSRNNWSVAAQKRCGKLQVGGKAGKCRNN